MSSRLIVKTRANDSGKQVSWAKLHRLDSLNVEAGKVSSFLAGHTSKGDWKTLLGLAFQSAGVIYGDIGTSLPYVFASFSGRTRVLSGCFQGTGSMGNLEIGFISISGYAKLSLIPNQQPEDSELSHYGLDIPSNKFKRAQKTRYNKLENSIFAKIVLVFLAILGTSMVIGDGVLTRCISVLCAVSGIKPLGQEAIMYISVAILVALFCCQRFGTDKVGYAFAPAISVWFLLISGIGLYNLFTYDMSVLRAFNPMYIFYYFKRNGKKGWLSLGGVFLCITGLEAMFADLGHFSVRSIQISFSCLVFPSILSAYIGQAAYLSHFPENVGNAFYASVPGPLYWPTFVVAVVTAIIASQAMISGAFSIVAQAQSLACFPRVKVVHTSERHEGQVYIPELNYFLMFACVVVTLGFKTTEELGHAYGIAVVCAEIITTNMVTLVMLLIWKTSIWRIVLFYMVYITMESTYLSAQLTKFMEGGYLPMTFSFVFVIIMGIWHYVQKKRYHFELNNKVSSNYIRDLAKNPDIKRVPGIGLLYSELVQGIPPIFPHFVSNIASVHSIIVLVSIKSIPISKVTLEERFLFRHVEPREYKVFRCVVRLGYNDQIGKSEDFESQLIDHLKEFIRQEHYIFAAHDDQVSDTEPEIEARKSSSSVVHVEEELQHLDPRISSSAGSIRVNTASAQFNHSSSLIQVVAPGLEAEEEMQYVGKP
ncbi:potassium transporter 5-like [Capsicum annuum]|uniref:potassium transporter 5-like n=1 Tax=Capsicum annuum TaxID=4072 RepID=UPI0007BF2DB7|nr:potassium transporter 5-like [Capsicum annuum]